MLSSIVLSFLESAIILKKETEKLNHYAKMMLVLF